MTRVAPLIRTRGNNLHKFFVSMFFTRYTRSPVPLVREDGVYCSFTSALFGVMSRVRSLYLCIGVTLFFDDRELDKNKRSKILGPSRAYKGVRR